MEASERKRKIMDATMRIVAEKGLESFAVLQAAKLAHVNEALVYRDFGTKENLLFECYNLVANEVAGLYDDAPELVLADDEKMFEQFHEMWIDYFTFLIKNDYKTLYYQSYRDSEHIKTYVQKEAEGKTSDFTGLIHVVEPVMKAFPLPEGMSMHYIWTYLMDISAVFAKRIIRKELPDTKESYEFIWNLMASGLSAYIKK